MYIRFLKSLQKIIKVIKNGKEQQERIESLEEKTEKIEKINEILELAQKVNNTIEQKYGKNSEEYQVACEEYFLLNASANKYKKMSFNELKQILVKKMKDADIHISEESISDTTKSGKGSSQKDSKDAKIMSSIEKTEKIAEAVEQIRKKYPQKNIGIGDVMCEKENQSFNDFFIIQIKGIHCYLLEKFNEKENSALYVINSSEINEVFELIREKRSILKLHPAVDTANHIDDNKDGYVTRVVQAIEATMQKDNLNDLWEEAFELEERIKGHNVQDTNPNNINGAIDRRKQYSNIAKLQQDYEKILTQIEGQEKAVGISDKKKQEKAEKYRSSGGKQL